MISVAFKCEFIIISSKCVFNLASSFYEYVPLFVVVYFIRYALYVYTEFTFIVNPRTEVVLFLIRNDHL